MVSPKHETLVHSIKVSSVGPGKITGADEVHEPTNIDLAMKLHYLRPVYYFTGLELTTLALKEAVFRWLNKFPFTCGRFRRAGSGRAHIKCNDCGARFVEAQCGKTIEEWLEMLKENAEIHRLLVPDNVLGPELVFSPLIYIQLTRFKCGGLSLGLSWAHVLGDAFSAADFIHALGQALAGHDLGQPIRQSNYYTEPKPPPSPFVELQSPQSVKRVAPVGDYWVNHAHTRNMEMFSIYLTTKQMTTLQHKVSGDNKIPPFEILCGFIWKIIAKIRNEHEPKMVTVCQNVPVISKKSILGNHQVISLVKATFSVLEASPNELSELVINQAIDERALIDKAMEQDNGLSDFAIYGSNLTFVNLEDANLYGFELKGKKPVYSSYVIDGVGEEGVVLVLAGPKNASEGGDGNKVVTLIMPDYEVLELKSEFKMNLAFA